LDLEPRLVTPCLASCSFELAMHELTQGQGDNVHLGGGFQVVDWMDQRHTIVPLQGWSERLTPGGLQGRTSRLP
jgi:hypothetical protein